MRGNTLTHVLIRPMKRHLLAAKALIVTKISSMPFNDSTKSLSRLADDASSITAEGLVTSLWIVAFLTSFLIRARVSPFMVRILKRKLRWAADVEAWVKRETRVGVVWEGYAVIVGLWRLFEFLQGSMHFLSHHIK